MTDRRRSLFVLLIAVQAAHSLEECWFRLYDVFQPAAFVAHLISTDTGFGFAVANLVLVDVGIWCYAEAIHPRRRAADAWLWGWTLLEAGNGMTHLTFATLRRGYAPGLFTAPLLLGVALALGGHLLQRRREVPALHT